MKHGIRTPKPAGCSWWKHMRKYGKRLFWKRNRKNDKQEVKREV
jgi:hypothetical protein